ncbi:Hypothetical protein GL50581_3922 [Giardia duodenalis ATCC 50581]|uniref:Uncharacterized protein n=1 Tax=Giardia intestinalis (strain ATCC 50581 / GS clone H7) TaxID=598745 RepID=C6LYP4_GIAIB|nr:Hypothetical protein GL50581_3922 [Giardia intestinalis ATCC 50581]
MVSLTAIVDKLTAVCKVCSEVWTDIGMDADEVEAQRQAFLTSVIDFADQFCNKQKHLVAELNAQLEEYAFKILDLGRQLGQSIAIPDAPTKTVSLQILKEVYERYSVTLLERKEKHTVLVQKLIYLLEGLGDEESLALAAELNHKVDIYDTKLLMDLEQRISKVEERSQPALQRIKRYLDSMASINKLLQRDLVQYAKSSNDGIMMDVFEGHLRPKYEEHVKEALHALEQEAKIRAKEVSRLKIEISDVLSLLHSSGLTLSSDPLSVVSPEAQHCLGVEGVISDYAVSVLVSELSRLKEMRLAQLPKIIASLQQEIYNSRREVFGALGQACDEEGQVGGNKRGLDEPPSEGLLLRLEEELKQLRIIEEHCEPICIAIRRYNEVVALQEELKVIMSDKTRLTSKSREAARIRHHEEDLKKQIQNLLPKTLAALRLKLTEMATTLPPDILNQLRGGDPTKPILFFGRNYEEELAAQLATKDQKIVRKYQMYLVAYRRNSSNIEILKLRDGEDKPVKRQTVVSFQTVELPIIPGSAAGSACGSCDASALSATADSADDNADAIHDLTLDALKSDPHDASEEKRRPALKKSVQIAKSKGVEASLGPERVRMKPTGSHTVVASSSAGRGNVTGVGIKSKRIPKQ